MKKYITGYSQKTFNEYIEYMNENKKLSEIVKEVGKRTTCPIIDIRLQLKDPTDLSGIPYINSHGEMVFAVPSDLPVQTSGENL